MHRTAKAMLRWGRFLPMLALYQSVSCLPNNAFREVFAENIVRTGAVAIQSFIALIFGSFVPVFIS